MQKVRLNRMAAAYVKIYCNNEDKEHLVRCYGGNRSDVRQMKKRYDEMTKERFCRKHPRFFDECEKSFNIISIIRYKKN